MLKRYNFDTDSKAGCAFDEHKARQGLSESEIHAEGSNVRKLLTLLMPVEWVLVWFGVLVIALYRYFGIPMPGGPGTRGEDGPILFYIKQVLTAADLYALILFCFLAFECWRLVNRHHYRVRDVDWRGFLTHMLTRLHGEQLVQDARFMNALLIMFVEFALLKNLIPLINPAVYDTWFLAADQLVCGGSTCSQMLHSVLGISPGVVSFVSENYFWYYPYMSLVAMIFIVGAPRVLAQRYLCTFVLVFMLGTVSIYAVPTWGPVYFEPQIFEFMRGTEINRLQQGLWRMKEILEHHAGSREAIFMISGFPSLHIAVVLTGSVYLSHIHWAVAFLSWIFLLLTINSTLYLGWHYLLDDVGAVALVYISYVLTSRMSWSWQGKVEYASIVSREG